MDPRLKALVEVRDLLKAEGWASEEYDESVPTRKPLLRVNPLLLVICLASIVTIFILIGANHDLRHGRHTSVNSVEVFVVENGEAIDPHIESSLLNSLYRDRLFVTVDGERVWEINSRLGTGQDRVGSNSRSSSKSIDTENRPVKLPGVSNPSMALIDNMSLLELWIKDDEGRSILLGLSYISANYPNGTNLEVNLVEETANRANFRVFVKLKIEQASGPAFASSRPTPRQ